MAKRSPILGYNHNVRYRGLVFHVQTEDSGLLSPHLFTHLFHGGVIISTRKLVYDAGAAEDAIKSLMQAQHKAVLKDLKRGSFDDKIDQYLAGTPGLLPRGEGGEGDEGRASEPAMATPAVPKPPVVAQARPRAEPATSRQQTESDVPAFELAPPGSPAARVARTKTAERGSPPGAVRSNLPPPPPTAEELGGPTLDDGDAASIAAAIAAANSTVPNRMPTNDATIPVEMPSDMSPLEIELELDEPDDHPRASRDTDVAQVDTSATIRNMPGDSVPPLPPAPPHQRAPSSVGAAALPPRAVTPGSKLPSRPAITPPQVVSRPIAARDEDKSGAVEVYAPPPPGAELPPGASDSSRPGQYSQHKRASQKVPVIETYKDRSQPIPSGLARPPSQSQSSGVPKPVGRDSSSNQARQTGGTPVVPQNARDSGSGTVRTDSGSTVAGMGRAGSGSNPGTGRSEGSRPTAAASSTQPRISAPGSQPRIAGSGSQPGTPQQSNSGSRPGTQQSNSGSRPGTQPAASRTASSSSSSGVVMTRPAVIVGAPAKPNQPQRVRKAREEEGRGFGQGLISEKSLDEVILAYLSEDADEK